MGGSAGRNRGPSTASVAAYRRATFSSGRRTSAPGKAGALVIFLSHPRYSALSVSGVSVCAAAALAALTS